MTNERGGILSNIIIIPAGVVLMVGIFFLGYFLGKYQNTPMPSGNFAPPLPELASSAAQKLEEFTFYKTLTGNNDNTVSIDIRPKSAKEKNKSKKQRASHKTQKADSVQSVKKNKGTEVKIEKEAFLPAKPKRVAKKKPAVVLAGKKIRYTVQTASYQEIGMARAEVKRLKKSGYAAFIASIELPGKGKWHRVRLGSFSKKGAAEKLQKTLRTKEGISPIVVME